MPASMSLWTNWQCATTDGVRSYMDSFLYNAMFDETPL